MKKNNNILNSTILGNIKLNKLAMLTLPLLVSTSCLAETNLYQVQDNSEDDGQIIFSPYSGAGTLEFHKLESRSVDAVEVAALCQTRGMNIVNENLLSSSVAYLGELTQFLASDIWEARAITDNLAISGAVLMRGGGQGYFIKAKSHINNELTIGGFFSKGPYKPEDAVINVCYSFNQDDMNLYNMIHDDNNNYKFELVHNTAINSTTINEEIRRNSNSYPSENTYSWLVENLKKQEEHIISTEQLKEMLDNPDVENDNYKNLIRLLADLRDGETELMIVGSRQELSDDFNKIDMSVISIDSSGVYNFTSAEKQFDLDIELQIIPTIITRDY
ncbi:hypothetical protein AKG98_846 [Moritella sp. JT01]|uniref:hypothetical protein n=1 Tax=Moritella sp. JT01 TaxID=756698 RepID=UPI0007923F7F|nr:hypothetical protein [Moritella sp. JT01]KXO10065.1 hypothetical protein AKG98_846 [Moritella sp. JT01]